MQRFMCAFYPVSPNLMVKWSSPGVPRSHRLVEGGGGMQSRSVIISVARPLYLHKLNMGHSALLSGILQTNS